MIMELSKKNKDLLKEVLDGLDDMYGSDNIHIIGTDEDFVRLEIVTTSEQEEFAINQIIEIAGYKSILETLENQFGKDRVNAVGIANSELFFRIKV